jgi:CNT family concentrative nucleoside transporter
MERFISVFGLVFLLLVAFAISNNRRRAVNLRLILCGLGLQILFGVLVLKTAPGRWLFDRLKDAFNVILGFTQAGSEFVFGNLARADGGMGFIFATQILPTIIFFSALMTVLYHLNLMQRVVYGMAWVMHRLMRTSGGESLAMAANVFVGQTEAPLVVRPYVDRMTRSELFTLMSGGMATIAGGVFAAYVGMGVSAGHLLSASVMSAPAALVISKIMWPETEQSLTAGEVKMTVEKQTVNVIDAACQGAGDGLKLALNVGAMLLAFLALVAMVNWLLGAVGGWFSIELSLERIMGYVFAPFAFVMGIPWHDCIEAGNLLGQKTVLNEFVAYMNMTKEIDQLSPRTVTILTYALCGFSNLGSIAIQIGGIGGMAPGRRSDLARMGLRAVIAGSLACFMTAAVAGMLIHD